MYKRYQTLKLLRLDNEKYSFKKQIIRHLMLCVEKYSVLVANKIQLHKLKLKGWYLDQRRKK